MSGSKPNRSSSSCRRTRNRWTCRARSTLFSKPTGNRTGGRIMMSAWSASAPIAWSGPRACRSLQMHRFSTTITASIHFLSRARPAIRRHTRVRRFTHGCGAGRRKHARYGSVCTGAFFLGAAGLLDGLSATTHWQHAAELAERFPAVKVVPDQIYVEDGQLYTSAGVTAGIDLALKLIEDDHGRELALKVARRLVVFLKRPGGQSQFSAHLAAQIAGEGRIQAVQHWILDHLPLESHLDGARGSGCDERAQFYPRLSK